MLAELFAKYVYGTDSLQSESDRLDAARQTENLKDRERYGEEWYQQTLQNDQGSRIDANAEIAAEFKAPALLTNLEESATSAAAGTKRFLAAPLNFLFGAIPWQLWLVGLAVAFWWLGGPAYVRGILNKK